MSELDDLRDAVRSLLAKHSDFAAVRAAVETDLGYDASLWQRLCEMGAGALLIPEAAGGAGAGMPAMTVVMMELGRVLAPSPLLGSAVLSAELLLGLGDDAAGERLLPAIASGETIVALCWSGSDGTWSEPAVAVADGVLHGTAHYVLDGDTADVLLVAASDGAVYEAAGGVATRTPAMDATRRLATVQFDDVPARRVGPASARAALDRARRAALVALAAESAGAAAGALERTVAYAKVREQFGRPIGSFQALKHRMADLHVTVESARSTALAAAEGRFDAEAAALFCGDALHEVAAEMIQLHGGIAITWEHDAHLYFKRAHAARRLFGTPASRLAAVARLAGASA